MSIIFRNLGQVPEETAHVLQNLVSANGLRAIYELRNAFFGVQFP